MFDIFERAKERDRELKPDEYRGTDGLIYCKICGKARQTNITVDRLNPEIIKALKEKDERAKRSSDKVLQKWLTCCAGIFPIMCDCSRAEISAREKKALKDDTAVKAERAKISSNIDINIKADLSRNTKQLEVLQRYTNGFGNGTEKYSLFLYGEPLTGKTYAANFLGAELVKKGYSVHFVKALEIARGGGKYPVPNVSAIIIDKITDLKKYGFDKEYLINFIDKAQRAKKPLIITSRMSANGFLNSADSESRKFGLMLKKFVRLEMKESYFDTMLEGSAVII